MPQPGERLWLNYISLTELSVITESMKTMLTRRSPRPASETWTRLGCPLDYTAAPHPSGEQWTPW